MLQHRELTTNLVEAFQIQFAQHHARPVRQARENFAPGIDDQAIAVSLPAIGVTATLRRRHHIALIFDSPRSQQRFPMGLAGRGGKRGWQRQDRHCLLYTSDAADE